MNLRYLKATFQTKLANVNSYGWPVHITLVALLIYSLSVSTNLLDWFWEIVVGGVNL